MPRQAVALDKRKLAADIRRDLKAQAAKRLKALADAVKASRARRDRAMANVRLHCRTARVASRERAKERLAALRQEIRDQRIAASQSCADAYTQARTLGDLERASAELTAERAYQAEIRRLEASNRTRRNEIHTSRAERRAESDDEVRQNIDPSLVALWERVKRGIRGTARKSRTEQFAEYVEAHPNEAINAIEAGIDAHIRQLEQRERTARRAYDRGHYDEVPF